MEVENHSFWFAQVILLFHLGFLTHDKMSEEIVFVSYFQVNTQIDNFDCVLNFMCLL